MTEYSSPATDYQRIAKAIAYIREHQQRQPDLEEIARQVCLSPYHFQRLFSRWAGTSPKRFLQTLTLARAKQLLSQQQPLLDTAYAVGLSSGSRLYDHFVQLEAVTPSEFKRAGQGLSISYGQHTTPFGRAFIAQTQRGICHFAFIGEQTIADLTQQLQDEWPQATLQADQAQAISTIENIFSRPASQLQSQPQSLPQSLPHNLAQPLPVWVRGTNFQIRVWQALLQIPAGQIVSYGDVARAIGQPQAARAVGSAIGANPVAFLIPCHRVLQQSGKLGGYRWGPVRKHAMLIHEQAQLEAPPAE